MDHSYPADNAHDAGASLMRLFGQQPGMSASLAQPPGQPFNGKQPMHGGQVHQQDAAGTTESEMPGIQGWPSTEPTWSDGSALESSVPVFRAVPGLTKLSSIWGDTVSDSAAAWHAPHGGQDMHAVHNPWAPAHQGQQQQQQQQQQSGQNLQWSNGTPQMEHVASAASQLPPPGDRQFPSGNMGNTQPQQLPPGCEPHMPQQQHQPQHHQHQQQQQQGGLLGLFRQAEERQRPPPPGYECHPTGYAQGTPGMPPHGQHGAPPGHGHYPAFGTPNGYGPRMPVPPGMQNGAPLAPPEYDPRMHAPPNHGPPGMPMPQQGPAPLGYDPRMANAAPQPHATPPGLADPCMLDSNGHAPPPGYDPRSPAPPHGSYSQFAPGNSMFPPAHTLESGARGPANWSHGEGQAPPWNLPNGLPSHGTPHSFSPKPHSSLGSTSDAGLGNTHAPQGFPLPQRPPGTPGHTAFNAHAMRPGVPSPRVSHEFGGINAQAARHAALSPRVSQEFGGLGIEALQHQMQALAMHGNGAAQPHGQQQDAPGVPHAQQHRQQVLHELQLARASPLHQFLHRHQLQQQRRQQQQQPLTEQDILRLMQHQQQQQNASEYGNLLAGVHHLRQQAADNGLLMQLIQQQQQQQQQRQQQQQQLPGQLLKLQQQQQQLLAGGELAQPAAALQLQQLLQQQQGSPAPADRLAPGGDQQQQQQRQQQKTAPGGLLSLFQKAGTESGSGAMDNIAKDAPNGTNGFTAGQGQDGFAAGQAGDLTPSKPMAVPMRPPGGVGAGAGNGPPGAPSSQPRSNGTPPGMSFIMARGRQGNRPGSRPWDLSVMNRELESLSASLLPTAEERNTLQQALDGVNELLRKEFPQGQVHLYGSAANGLLISRTNDIDICLDLGPAYDCEVDKSAAVARLGEVMTEANMDKVVSLPKARVPVVKFIYPLTGTSVDVTINNALPLANTRLLSTYAAIDPRLRQLVVMVKHWAKTRGVNDTYRGTLSSYAYVLLCVGLLQQRSPPILPVLQQLPNRRPHTVAGWDCSFYDDMEALTGFGKGNTETLGELLVAFFDYWARLHDYNNTVLSVRMGQVISKRSKDWTKRQDRDRHLVCIEDPFELTHDLGRCVDWQSVRTLRGEFERAARILAIETDPLPLLFQPWQNGGQQQANV